MMMLNDVDDYHEKAMALMIMMIMILMVLDLFFSVIFPTDLHPMEVIANFFTTIFTIMASRKSKSIASWQRCGPDPVCSMTTITTNLGGGFKYFLFSPLLGEDSHFD